MKNMYQGTKIEKNNLIKQFLFLNIGLFVLILLKPVIFIFLVPAAWLDFLMPYNWIIETASLIILIFFIFKYFKNKKDFLIKSEHEIRVLIKIKDFSILDVNAEVIIGQFFILVNILSFRLDLSSWIKMLLLLPLVFIAVILKKEYKKNKKLILNK